MSTTVWLPLSSDERNLLGEALAAYIAAGNAEVALALLHKIADIPPDAESIFACIVRKDGRVDLTETEYGIIESALEWRIADLDDGVASEKGFDDGHREELQVEARHADRIWRQM